MRMTDKAGGELGKAIAHPLQAKVDRIIQEAVGDKCDWKKGSSVSIADFESINNKSYVHKRMMQLGFLFDADIGEYHFISHATSMSSLSVPAINPEFKKKSKIIDLKTRDQFLLGNLKNTLLSGAIVTSKYLDKSSRRSLATTIQMIAAHYGLSAIRLRVKDSKCRYMVYALNQSTIDDFARKNLEILCGVKAVEAWLDFRGEIKYGSLNMNREVLSTYISRLRAQGWVIRTISRPNSSVSYRLVSRP